MLDNTAFSVGQVYPGKQHIDNAILVAMDDPQYIIDVKDLNKSFNGKPAVINASLQVKKGEIFGFLGPNGSGKTTTIRMICGLLTPDSGSGTCLGYDVLRESYKIKKHVGYMTQKFSLYGDLSVYENLDFNARLYGVKKRKPKIEKSIQDLGLTDRKSQLAATLSGGWKQRLALAAALLHQPDLLLLDEPTAGVDPKARRDFWDQVNKLALQGITTLVSTHYMDEAERCTRLAYIAYGNILTTGTAQEVVEKSKLHTWSVRGLDTLQLSEQLRNQPGVDQVAPFGNVLHISGHDEQVLAQTVEKFSHDKRQWRKIEPSLEDVFISLVGEMPERNEG